MYAPSSLHQAATAPRSAVAELGVVRRLRARLHEMTTSFIATKRSSALGVAALALTTFGWLWFVVCFSARVGTWWNSLYFFAAIYLVATVVAMLGIRSVLSIFGLVLALLSLGFVSIFILG